MSVTYFDLILKNQINAIVDYSKISNQDVANFIRFAQMTLLQGQVGSSYCKGLMSPLILVLKNTAEAAEAKKTKNKKKKTQKKNQTN